MNMYVLANVLCQMQYRTQCGLKPAASSKTAIVTSELSWHPKTAIEP